MSIYRLRWPVNLRLRIPLPTQSPAIRRIPSDVKLILASSSPRRREILSLLGAPFDAIEPEFDERVNAHRSIEQEVLEFAVGKARSVAPHHPESIIIGSDTMIFLDGAKIGKPKDSQDAARILDSLSGKTHRIYTGVAIVDTSG